METNKAKQMWEKFKGKEVSFIFDDYEYFDGTTLLRKGDVVEDWIVEDGTIQITIDRLKIVRKNNQSGK